jgi:hypothetical protein
VRSWRREAAGFPALWLHEIRESAGTEGAVCQLPATWELPPDDVPKAPEDLTSWRIK